MICRSCKNVFVPKDHTRGKFCSLGCAGISFQNTPEIFWRYVNKTQTCWLWKRGTFTFGYGAFQFGGKLCHAHRLAYFFVHGQIPKGKMVLHRCDVPACVNPKHLYLGTQVDNVKDRVERGRSARGNKIWSRSHPERVLRGEASPNARLTANEVTCIKSLYQAGGISHRQLAKMFGMHKSQITRILACKSWNHITKTTIREPSGQLRLAYVA